MIIETFGYDAIILALAVECRENDDYILNLIKEVDHERTKICCTAERTFMKVMEGGCQVPIGVHTELEDGAKTKLKMKAIILSVDWLVQNL